MTSEIYGDIDMSSVMTRNLQAWQGIVVVSCIILQVNAVSCYTFLLAKWGGIALVSLV